MVKTEVANATPNKHKQDFLKKGIDLPFVPRLIGTFVVGRNLPFRRRFHEIVSFLEQIAWSIKTVCAPKASVCRRKAGRFAALLASRD
jgi:hypothetical protein